MTLTNRLSLFFLAALGLVLAGFSTALYTLASIQLLALQNQKLEAAMQTLVASAEVFPDHVEWEPLLRHITVGEDPAPDQVRWLVHASDGRLMDCSLNLEKDHHNGLAPGEVGWRLVSSRISAGIFEPQPLAGWNVPRSGSLHDPFPTGQMTGESILPSDRTFTDASMILTAGIAEGQVQSFLHQLALWMGLVSCGIWLLAAVGGRWLCRRALAPVSRMANSARALRMERNTEKFLDVLPTGDELEDLGIAFNKLLGDLRESFHRQERFAGDASHQLRTPVTAMMAMVEVALRQERPQAEYRKVLESIGRRGRQLGQIIESLLFLARPEQPADLPAWERINLADWCGIWLFSWEGHPRHGDIKLEMAATPMLIHTHPALLAQILDNLLDNACKYSEPGSPIKIGIRLEVGKAAIRIADQGCGIEAADLGKIFEPFYRSEQARWLGKPGAGLGLTLAQRLTCFLEGTLSVKSVPQQGTEFTLALPAEAPLEAPPEGVGRDGPLEATRSNGTLARDEMAS